MTDKKNVSEAARVNRKSVGPETVKSVVVKPKPIGSAAAESPPVRPERVKPDPVEPAQLASARAESSLLKPKLPKPRGILHYLGLGLSAGLLALVLLIAALAIVVPAVTGSLPMTILTGSMAPNYPPGTLIIVKPVDTVTLRIGDAITYQIESGKPAVVTHRIIASTTISDGTRTFTTQGDANNTADAEPVLGVQVRGKVWYSIPYLGWVNTVVNGESRTWIIPVIAGGLFLYAGYMGASGIAGALKRRKRGNE